VTVSPVEAAAGAVQRYIVNVPSEKPIPTTGVEIDFPTELHVTGVDTPTAWTVTTAAGRDGRIVGAAWTGGTIAPQRSLDFGVVARTPAAETTLAWKVIQTYQDGREVHWTGPPASEFPAAVTIVRGGIGAFLVATLAIVFLAGITVMAVLIGRARRPRT
jgi:uncharacterized protein YcnI